MPCDVCKREYVGQGSAYFGPACPLGDKCRADRWCDNYLTDSQDSDAEIKCMGKVVDGKCTECGAGAIELVRRKVELP